MFYIYERSSTYIMGKIDKHSGLVRPDHRQSYKTMPAAKAALTRMSKRHRADMLDSANDPQFRYGIAEAEYFHKSIEKSVKRKTLDIGYGSKEYMETVNTPNYMSPASETYWSM
jgi:hypothetical protein